MVNHAAITSGFGKGIEAGNLRLCQHGAVHVSLADDWAGIAQRLQSLGDVFATTQNAVAVLKQMGRFPAFDFCACGRFATNQFGGLGFDLGEWHRVWATRRSSRDGVWHTLTVTGHDHAAAHQILLTGEVDEKQFADFARRFQGEPDSRRRWTVRGEGVCTGHLERLQIRKWQFVETTRSGAARLHLEALPSLFEGVLIERLRLSATVISEPAIQSSLWTPTTLEQGNGWLTLTSESTQLRLRLEPVAKVWTVPLEAGGGSAVECYDARDRLLFGLSAADGQESQWQQLLNRLSKV